MTIRPGRLNSTQSQRQIPTIIAQSPDNFFPTAELNILPIYDVRIKDLGPDPKTAVFKLLQNMAPG